MRVLVHTIQRLFILVAVTVALVATGFGHRMPTENDAALQAYVLAGGDLGDLCADTEGDGLPDHGDCPVCHIVATVDLPASNLTLHDADLAFVAEVVAPRESRAVRNVLDPARGMRAPPLA
ncbi:MAG: hypothetical protein R3D63_04335 [Paracoccaceae bacterium]